MPPDSPESVMEYVKSIVQDERISYRVLGKDNGGFVILIGC